MIPIIIAGRQKNKNVYHVDLGICPTLTAYYEQPIFEKSVTNEFFDSEKGKLVKTHIYSVKNKFTEDKPVARIEHCSDSSDYIQFNTFYIAKKKDVTADLSCDLIKPKLSFVSYNKQCGSIGEYYTQFGIKVLYNFYKYLFGVKKKNERDFVSNMLTSALKRLVNKFNKIKSNKKKDIIRIGLEAAINKYYKTRCKKIIPHYNDFYTFYTAKYTKEKKEKGHVDTAHCDYFIRIPIDYGK